MEEALSSSLPEPSRNGFEAASRAHYRYVFGLVQSKLRNHQDAMDVTQDVFVKAQRNWSSLQNPERPLAWLTQIAMNTATDFLRSQTRRKRLLERVEAPAEPDARPDPAAVHRLLGELDDELHTIICLRYQNGLSYQEIARELGISRDAVRGKLYRAHQELRRRRKSDEV